MAKFSIVNFQGKEEKLEFDDSGTTIAEIKKIICNIQGFSVEDHGLIFDSKFRKDDETIECCGIVDGSIVF